MKRYAAGGTAFQLNIPRLDISPGAKLAFVGESGSGKSTLLELLALILRPSSSGEFQFCPDDSNTNDINAAWLNGDADHLSTLRSRHIGYVLQTGGLLPYLTVRENINLSRQLLHYDHDDTAEHWAKKLGIDMQLSKLPGELSVGQRQRVAIARSLAHEPSVIIADEPTASIDPVNAQRIVDLLVGLVDELGVTLIVATHALSLVQRAGLNLIDHKIDTPDDNSMQVTVSHATA